MNMQPRIERVDDIKLIGRRSRMSFANNQTVNLWQSFMPRQKEITNSISGDLYSVEVYGDPHFFKHFNPANEFEKWAAVPVSSFEIIPENMGPLVIPAGEYAVFHYRGKPSEAQATYQYIHGEWIPNSPYELDDRPHFALMGEKYKGEHPESEEELWIPIRQKIKPAP
jgi:AraC family transcriptional regulator